VQTGWRIAVDIDLAKFFDAVDHDALVKLLGLCWPTCCCVNAISNCSGGRAGLHAMPMTYAGCTGGRSVCGAPGGALRHQLHRALKKAAKLFSSSATTAAPLHAPCLSKQRIGSRLRAVYPCPLRFRAAMTMLGCVPEVAEVHSMRTNIEIDDKLMKDALRVTGAKTKKEAVELGLRTLLDLRAQEKARELRGKITWEGDLNAMRTDQ
jgi:Arc/MetJ family transcription regulator